METQRSRSKDLIAEARRLVELTGVRQSTVLIDRLADALEVAEARAVEADAACDAAIAVIEEAREWRDPAYEAGLGSPDDYANGYRMALRNIRRILSSVPADVLRERDAEKWDEGAKAMMRAASEEQTVSLIAPWNPYRKAEEESND